MNKATKLTAILVFLLVIASCKSNKFSFINEYPVKNTPLIDSTSFDNHLEGKLLSKKEQELLQLPSLFEEQLKNENAKIGISYLPKLSDNYTSVVYYFYPNNTELISMLVNYDGEFNIINSQVLAYDEIVENMLRTTSKLHNDVIELTEYISDNTSTIRFKISENGDITRE